MLGSGPEKGELAVKVNEHIALVNMNEWGGDLAILGESGGCEMSLE